MEPEAVAVDDDRDAGDLGLGLEGNDGQDFVDEGEKLERVLNLTVGLMSTLNSGNMMRPGTHHNSKKRLPASPVL